MQLLDAYARIKSLKQPFVTTRDAAVCWNISSAHASQVLLRLSKSKIIIALNRSHWVINPMIDPLRIPEFIVSPWPCYISLHTALFYHGMIEQVPHVIYAVSLSRTKRYQTSLGVFSIHQLHPDFFFGFEMYGQDNIKMATPEKALLDFLYLKTAKSKLFSALPELELSQNFDTTRLEFMIHKISDIKRRTLIKNQLSSHLLTFDQT